MINPITIGNKVSEIASVVLNGLSRIPKRLPSWLFYDEKGDKLFQQIMNMPEYYLTRCEYDILETNKEHLLEYLDDNGSPFNLIELGAGDGIKTEILLRYFSGRGADYVYTPTDVSKTVLRTLKNRLSINVPGLIINPMENSYEDALMETQQILERKVFLFLGANIGNFNISEAIIFLSKISNAMLPGDYLLVGFDLKKDPRLILAAYDDAHGFTRDFNLNLLHRLNRELGGNFDKSAFSHYPFYDPETGMMKSYLVSQQHQQVYFELCDRIVHFDKWEPIHTEISQKYNQEMIATSGIKANLEIVCQFFDGRKYFCDVLFKKLE